MGDLLYQGLVFTPASLGESTGYRVESLTNALPAHDNVGHHKRGFEGCEVVCRAGNGDRPISVEHTMAITDVAGADAGELQRHYVFVQQAKQPAERAYKALRLVRPPVHSLGPGEGAYFLAQLLTQHLFRSLARPLHGGGGVFTFGRGDFPKRRNGSSCFFGEGLRRWSGLSLREGCFP